MQTVVNSLLGLQGLHLKGRSMFPFTSHRVLLFFVLFFSFQGKAQLPECNKLYLFDGTGTVTNNHIYTYDPTIPLSTSNPSLNAINTPPGATGLAVSDNISGPGPSPTFYTTLGGYFYYYDGTGWVNTGHLCMTQVGSLGAGGGFIYNKELASGMIYRYNGMGDAVLVPIAQSNAGGLCDLACDCSGNFYTIWRDSNWNLHLRKYSSSGTLIQTWAVSGATTYISNGLAFLGNVLYTSGVSAVLSTTSSIVNFFPVFTTSSANISSLADMAACAGGDGLGPIIANIDTGYYCGKVPISLAATGVNGPVSASWSVISGQAAIYGYGSSVTAEAADFATIQLTATCYTPDTITIFGPAQVDAGADIKIAGCNGYYVDTLNSSLDNVKAGIVYTYSWSPMSSVLSGGTSADAVVNPVAPTAFVLTVTTPPDKGACIWKDTVNVYIADSSVIPDFSYKTNYGCTGYDTVIFNNLSVGATHCNWDFGDGTLDASINPLHIYPYNSYSVTLVTSNGVCKDSISKNLIASSHAMPFYLGDDTSFCQGEPFNLPLQAILSDGARAVWSDGSSQLYFNVRDTGTYWLTISNEPCVLSDTIKVIADVCDCITSMPSAFSPNNDGHNDLFRPAIRSGCLVKGFVINIYNRWGQLVYTGTNIETGWDGTFGGEPVDIGTYMFELQMEAGTQSKKIYRKGDVIVIR